MTVEGVVLHLRFEVNSERVSEIVEDKVRQAFASGRPEVTFTVVQRWWVRPAFWLAGYAFRLISRHGYSVR